MIRRRGGIPPEPFDTHDTGRDHFTGQEKKNDDRDHSAKNRIATAAAPNTVQEDSMSVTANPTRFRRTEPEWAPEYDPATGEHFAMGPAIWEPGIDLYTATDAHHGPQAYDADGHLIPAGDLLRYAVRRLQIHDVLLRAQRQHDLASRQAAPK
ncbi:hypothetical protein EDL96_05705 [Kocuria soli]|uniref:Uncharacterized protein n=1 Tax=Kocuria soli TaxID=2485125 RepID=A0A3N4A5B3_9MICC|nr:hypothetical protein [Kocuria soli]ROZ63830.1 hypothetical protein EDL96_05705 [Kocuria soli]